MKEYWNRVVYSMLLMATAVSVYQEGFGIASMAITVVAVVVFIKALKNLKFT